LTGMTIKAKSPHGVHSPGGMAKPIEAALAV
jgi:hypothetical protein